MLNYIKRYLRVEKPKTLSDYLIKTKQVEELGPNLDADIEIKFIKDSLKVLMTRLGPPTILGVPALASPVVTNSAYPTHDQILTHPYNGNFEESIAQLSKTTLYTAFILTVNLHGRWVEFLVDSGRQWMPCTQRS